MHEGEKWKGSRSVVSNVWEDTKSGLMEIVPLTCPSAIWGQYPVFSHLESTYCALSGVAAAVPRWQNLFPSWVTSGLNFRVPAMWWLDDCNILSLLIRQVTFLVHTLFSSVCQSCPALCDPWTAAHQASLSITNSRSLLRLMSIESMMPSNHLILCLPLLLLPSVFPSIRVSYNESVLRIRCPKYWSFTFSINSSSEDSGQWIFCPEYSHPVGVLLWRLKRLEQICGPV